MGIKETGQKEKNWRKQIREVCGFWGMLWDLYMAS